MAKKAYVRNSDNTEWVELASATTDLDEYLLQSSASSAYLSKNEASYTYLTQTSASTTYAPIVPAVQTGFRNVLINGGFAIDQRNNGEQHTVSSTPAYTTDRWYAYLAPGSPFTVPSQRIAGSAPSQYHYRIGGSMGNDAFGVGQRIEAANSFHLAGKNVTLSINIASSVLTSITWTAFRANTTDTFGTLASPTRTQIATGTFSINSTLSQKTATFEVPLAATTGIEILFTTGSLPMGETVTFSQAQLELGTIATPFEQRPYGLELSLCQRYFVRLIDPSGSGVSNGGTANGASRVNVSLPVEMRVPPTSVTANGTFSFWDGTNAPSGTLAATSSFFPSRTSIEVEFDLTGAITAGKAVKMYTSNSTSKWLNVSAEL